MQRFILGRVIQSLVSMFVVSIVVFALVRLSGDPIQIMMPAEASKADIELVRAHLGLDRPWVVQYWRFATQALQGDFGRSVRFRRPALDLVAERYGATLELGGLAVLIVLVVALPVGVLLRRPPRHRARLHRARLRGARPLRAVVLARHRAHLDLLRALGGCCPRPPARAACRT